MLLPHPDMMEERPTNSGNGTIWGPHECSFDFCLFQGHSINSKWEYRVAFTGNPKSQMIMKYISSQNLPSRVCQNEMKRNQMCIKVFNEARWQKKPAGDTHGHKAGNLAEWWLHNPSTRLQKSQKFPQTDRTKDGNEISAGPEQCRVSAGRSVTMSSAVCHGRNQKNASEEFTASLKPSQKGVVTLWLALRGMPQDCFGLSTLHNRWSDRTVCTFYLCFIFLHFIF